MSFQVGKVKFFLYLLVVSILFVFFLYFSIHHYLNKSFFQSNHGLVIDLSKKRSSQSGGKQNIAFDYKKITPKIGEGNTQFIDLFEWGMDSNVQLLSLYNVSIDQNIFFEDCIFPNSCFLENGDSRIPFEKNGKAVIRKNFVKDLPVISEKMQQKFRYKILRKNNRKKLNISKSGWFGENSKIFFKKRILREGFKKKVPPSEVIKVIPFFDSINIVFEQLSDNLYSPFLALVSDVYFRSQGLVAVKHFSHIKMLPKNRSRGEFSLDILTGNSYQKGSVAKQFAGNIVMSLPNNEFLYHDVSSWLRNKVPSYSFSALDYDLKSGIDSFKSLRQPYVNIKSTGWVGVEKNTYLDLDMRLMNTFLIHRDSSVHIKLPFEASCKNLIEIESVDNCRLEVFSDNRLLELKKIQTTLKKTKKGVLYLVVDKKQAKRLLRIRLSGGASSLLTVKFLTDSQIVKQSNSYLPRAKFSDLLVILTNGFGFEGSEVSNLMEKAKALALVWRLNNGKKIIPTLASKENDKKIPLLKLKPLNRNKVENKKRFELLSIERDGKRFILKINYSGLSDVKYKKISDRLLEKSTLSLNKGNVLVYSSEDNRVYLEFKGNLFDKYVLTKRPMSSLLTLIRLTVLMALVTLFIVAKKKLRGYGANKT